MGLFRLGSKLKSKNSFGSGAFGLADDLKGLYSQKSESTEKQWKPSRQGSHIPREKFYEDAEIASHKSVDKSYYQKRDENPDDENYGFGTSLHDAAAIGDTKDMQRLLFEGCPVDAEDAAGCTALHLAVTHLQLWACEILLQNGANVNAEDLEGSLPLHKCALWIGQEPDREIISLLVHNGADVSAQNASGWTAMHEAAVNGQAEVVDQLAAMGASVFDRTKEGDTALHKAARWGRVQVVELLLLLGSDVNACDNMGRRPVDRTNDPEVIDMLLHAHDNHPGDASYRQQYEQRQQQQQQHQWEQQYEPEPEYIPASQAPDHPAHVRTQSIVADLWEAYEVRWTLFNSQKEGGPMLSLRDIPFPVPPNDTSASLTDVVLYGTKDADSKRKRLRSELLRWHPDKFMGKFGSRLQESDREAIMVQVKDTARVLHEATKMC